VIPVILVIKNWDFLLHIEAVMAYCCRGKQKRKEKMTAPIIDNHDDDGGCVHPVERERRKTERRERIALNKRVDEHEKHIGRLLTAKNIIYGYSFLATIVILGCYKYIDIHDQYAKTKYAQYETALNSANDRIAVLDSIISSNYSRTDERYKSLTTQIVQLSSSVSNLNENVVKFIEIILDNGGRNDKPNKSIN